MPKIDQYVLNKILSLKITGNIFIAYSGGLDSASLLHIIASNKERFGDNKIIAVHVDHGLQSVSAQWAYHCEQISLSYGIGFKLIKPVIEKNPGESLELAARNARYAEFEKLINNESDVMLFAHHADDQIETFLQQALRGAGVHGLGGIPETRSLGAGYLFRPLLDISRTNLEKYAEQHELEWVEDPTNQQPDFDRNLLRNEIIPQLEKRWPGAKKGILRSLLHCREASKQIDAEASKILAAIADNNHLIVARLAELDFVRQKNVIRLWIKNHNIVLPNTERLEVGINSLINAAEDKNPILDWGFGIIRRYQGMLYIDRVQSEVICEELPWDLTTNIQINNSDYLEVKEKSGIGLKKECVLVDNASIRYRIGGERCRPFGRSGRHELKKLFQEYKVPPWMRDRVPLLYIGDEIAAVIGYCYCEPFADKGEVVIEITKMPAN